MHDFIAIGDTVTDAFIKLKEAELNPEKDKLTMAFGDKVPYESVEVIPAVGNSANASVSAARLGLSSALVSYLGNDHHGDESLKRLKEENVSTELVSVQAGKQSNYHYVLWYGDDRTILVKHQEYERVMPEMGKPKWLYLSSLGEDTLEYHKQIESYLNNNPEVSFAFQPGTFQMKIGKDALQPLYKRAKIFFCNVDEAKRILNTDTSDIKELLKQIKELGPEIAVITDGPKGAYAYDGTNMWFQTPYPDPKPPFERTGAGDAFASTTVSALALGLDLSTGLSWGAINAMSVVQQVGAQKGLLSRSQIEEYLKSAPTDFQIKKLT